MGAVLCAMLLAAAASVVGPGYVLPDPGYAARTPTSDPARRRIGHLVRPAPGFPALAAWGGEVELVLFGLADAGQPGDWRITMQASGSAPPYALRVLSATLDRAAEVVRLHAEVPARAPRDTYDLVVQRGALSERAPRSLRVYGALGARIRFALTADHQLWDPSWKQHAGDRLARAYPQRGERDANRAMERQVRHELELLDPDFVLDAGDFVFGLDYAAEYDELYRELSENRLATFAVPGNHDGYAIYDVRISRDPVALTRAALACHREIAELVRQGTWSAGWQALVCAYGNVKDLLYQSLARDGLVAWRRTVGPPFWAFDHGPLHVVGLNTYDGSPERRHAFAVSVDAFDLHLGAPAVDNYGGYLGDEQLDWLEHDLAQAQSRGKTIVVVGHHDPRGNLANAPDHRYDPNLPFPTDPLSLGGFKEWQYDGDWGERHGRESAREHSGTRLLRLIARYASAYLSGHCHRDEQRTVAVGEELAPGIRAERTIELIRVTTAAGAPGTAQAYWGYRILELADGRLSAPPQDAAKGLYSVPAGNFWAEPPRRASQSAALALGGVAASADGDERVLVNGLAQPVEARIGLVLPERPEGYRFFVAARPAVELPLSDVGDGGLFVVTAPLPGAGAGVAADGRPVPTRTVVRAVPATGNHPPVPALDVAAAPAGRLVAGSPVTLSAAASRDPDAGDGLVVVLWTLPDGRTVRGTTAEWLPAAEGHYVATLEVVDRHGARARLRHTLDVDPSPPPGARRPLGCGCQIGSAERSPGQLAAILSALVAGGVFWRRRDVAR
jgi:MYXO-CTERM domain-containing protein